MHCLERTAAAFLLLAVLLLGGALSVAGQTVTEVASDYADRAIDHYPALQAERQEIAIASAKRREAFGAMLPDVSAGSRYTRATGGREIQFDVNDFLPASVIPTDVPATVIPFMRETEQETKLSVVQPLFTGGGLYHQYRASKAAEEASRARFHGKENDLHAAVRKACYDAYAARELLTMRSQQVEQAGEQLRTVREKEAASLLPVSELKRAESAYAAAEADSITASAQAQVALAALNRMTGDEWDTPLPDIEGPATLPPLTTTLEEAKAAAAGNRPELRSLGKALQSVENSVKASRSSYLPSLVFAGEYGFQGEEYNFDSDADYSTASLVLNWNLFEGGRRSARVQQAKLAERQLEYRQVEAQDNIALDVTAAWLTAGSKQGSWVAAKRGLDAAQEGYRITNELFAEGMANQLQILDARAALSGAQTAEITSRYAYLGALADLERSMGLAYLGEKE